MAFVLANVRKRRLRDKQPTPAYYALPAPAFAALADEAWSELMSLSNDARRKHMHYVHVRTNHPDHRQHYHKKAVYQSSLTVVNALLLVC